MTSNVETRVPIGNSFKRKTKTICGAFPMQSSSLEAMAIGLPHVQNCVSQDRNRQQPKGKLINHPDMETKTTVRIPEPGKYK